MDDTALARAEQARLDRWQALAHTAKAHDEITRALKRGLRPEERRAMERALGELDRVLSRPPSPPTE